MSRLSRLQRRKEQRDPFGKPLGCWRANTGRERGVLGRFSVPGFLGIFLCLLFLPTSAPRWQCSLFSGAWARSLGPVHIKNVEAETPGDSLWLALRQPHSLQPRGRAGAQAQALVPSLAGDKRTPQARWHKIQKHNLKPF